MDRADFFTLKNGKKTKLHFTNKEYDQRVNNLRAVGPDCSLVIDSFFSKTHKTYSLKSNWTQITDKKFQLMFLDFCNKVINKNKNYHEWLQFRKEKIIKNKSKLTVHNKDFLAIKI